MLDRQVEADNKRGFGRLLVLRLRDVRILSLRVCMLKARHPVQKTP